MMTATEERLREVLDAMAGRVRPDPSAYRRTQETWRRRERKRRLLVAAVATVAIAGADAAGLWALNQTHPRGPVVFDGPLPHPTSLVVPVPPGS